MAKRKTAVFVVVCLFVAAGLLFILHNHRSGDPERSMMEPGGESPVPPSGTGMPESPGLRNDNNSASRRNNNDEILQRSQATAEAQATENSGGGARTNRREHQRMQLPPKSGQFEAGEKEQPAGEAPGETGNALLEGTVEDASFTPVPGASVTATRADSRQAHRVSTGPDGRFSFDGIRAGTYRLEAGKGEARGRAGPVPVVGDQTPAVTIVLGADASIGGRVLDKETRAPVPGIRLQAWDAGAGHSVDGYSDGSGAFRIPVPAPAIYKLYSRGNSDHVDETLSLTIAIAEGEHREDVVYFIQRGIRLEGTVTDGNEEAVPDTTVLLVNLLNDQGGNKGETSSDTAGQFSFSGVRPGGRYVARAIHPVHGFGQSAPVATTAVGGQGRLDVRLRPGQSVRGRLRTSDDAKVAGIPIWLIREGGQPWRPIPGTRVVSAADGGFSIPNVPAGAWQFIVVTAKTTRLRSAPFIVVEGEETELVDVDLGVGVEGFIMGQVTSPEEEPLPAVEVITYSGTAPINGVTRTDAEGQYRIDGLGPASSYRVIARGYNLGRFRKGKDDVPVNSSEVDFVLGKMASISGRVLDGNTGAPVQSFHVTGPIVDRDFESPDGRFVIDNIQVSEGIFRFSAPGYLAATYDPGEVPEGGVIENVEVALGAPGWIEGTVRFAATGAPIPGARLKLILPGVLPIHMIEREFFWDTSDPYTDAAGRFILAAHPEGQANSFVVAYPDHVPVVTEDSLERVFDIVMEQMPD